MRKVVITGMGIWSCLGTSIAEVKDSLYQGKSGIGLEPERLEYGFQSPLTGIVPRPSLKGVIDRHLRRGLSEEAEYAFTSISRFELGKSNPTIDDVSRLFAFFGKRLTIEDIE